MLSLSKFPSLCVCTCQSTEFLFRRHVTFLQHFFSRRDNFSRKKNYRPICVHSQKVPSISSRIHCSVFKQFTYMKYYRSVKIEQYIVKKIPTEDRWMYIFKHSTCSELLAKKIAAYEYFLPNNRNLLISVQQQCKIRLEFDEK